MGKKDGQVAAAGDLGYFRESTSFALGIVSVLPLVVLYHFGIVQSGYAVRNMAEVWLEGPLHLFGLRAAHVLNVVLIIALIAVLWRSERTKSPTFLMVILMVAEGAFYALLLFRGGQLVTEAVHEKARQVVFALDLSRAGPLCLALGAGVYEELLFRLLLVGGGAWALRKVFLWDRKCSLAVTLVLSSLLFAAAHHVGPMGEPFESYNFTFRTVCGLALGLLFVLRGLGVAVWTHAIYNAMVVL